MGGDFVTLEDTVWAVKDNVRNYFNENNSPDEPPVNTPRYERFFRLCERIHEWRGSQAGQPSGISSEMVVGLYQKSVGTKADGSPVGWAQVFADELRPYRLMFSGV